MTSASRASRPTSSVRDVRPDRWAATPRATHTTRNARAGRRSRTARRWKNTAYRPGPGGRRRSSDSRVWAWATPPTRKKSGMTCSTQVSRWRAGTRASALVICAVVGEHDHQPVAEDDDEERADAERVDPPVAVGRGSRRDAGRRSHGGLAHPASQALRRGCGMSSPTQPATPSRASPPRNDARRARRSAASRATRDRHAHEQHHGHADRHCRRGVEPRRREPVGRVGQGAHDGLAHEVDRRGRARASGPTARPTPPSSQPTGDPPERRLVDGGRGRPRGARGPPRARAPRHPRRRRRHTPAWRWRGPRRRRGGISMVGRRAAGSVTPTCDEHLLDLGELERDEHRHPAPAVEPGVGPALEHTDELPVGAAQCARPRGGDARVGDDRGGHLAQRALEHLLYRGLQGDGAEHAR